MPKETDYERGAGITCNGPSSIVVYDLLDQIMLVYFAQLPSRLWRENKVASKYDL